MHFYCLVYNKFSKMATERARLSDQEANLLFESTFLAIMQQNLLEKQKNMKNKGNALRNSPRADPHPHIPNCSTQALRQTQELCAGFLIMDLYKNREKVMTDTSHKFSTDKEESCNEAHSLSPVSSLKLTEKDWNSDPLQIKLTPLTMNQCKISE